MLTTNGTTTEARAVVLREKLAALPAEVFQFDQRMQTGWYADAYFPLTAKVLEADEREPIVTMQVFSKKKGIAAGLLESVRMIQTMLAPGYDFHDLVIETLIDGDPISPWETVMLITGPYRAFAHLETTYLGVIARRTLVASNVAKAVDAANGKPLIFMAPRHDDFRVSVADGYAARVGGASSVSSDAGAAWWGGMGGGTTPHALIACYRGDTVAAALAYGRYIKKINPKSRPVVIVDYHNNCVTTALDVARAYREEFGDGVLAGVRLDTSEYLVDESLIGQPNVWGSKKVTGVNAALVHNVRNALDAEGFSYVGVWVSGGFHPGKIAEFEAAGVPVAGYGVGSSLVGHTDGEGGLTSSHDFTADIVMVDGEPESKTGRGLKPNDRLVKVDWSLLELTEETSSRR